MRMFRGIDLDARRRVVLECKDATRTQQSQKEDADINVIVRRFGVTGQLPLRLDRLNLGAFTGIFDYQTAMNALVAADRAFASVPSDVRKRFGNDPQEFMKFCSDPENLPEMRKLKLAPPEVVVVESPPMKVEVVNPASPVPPPPK